MSWLFTCTGRVFDFDDLPDEYPAIELAIALASICRFGGHTKQHYSVAEHCVLMLSAADRIHPGLDPDQRLAILLHDAAEAYVGDLSRPLRAHLDGHGDAFKRVERRILERIHAERDLAPPDHYEELIEDLHAAMMAAEWKQVFRTRPPEHNFGASPLEARVAFWDRETAAAKYLAAHSEMAQELR